MGNKSQELPHDLKTLRAAVVEEAKRAVRSINTYPGAGTSGQIAAARVEALRDAVVALLRAEGEVRAAVVEALGVMRDVADSLESGAANGVERGVLREAAAKLEQELKLRLPAPLPQVKPDFKVGDVVYVRGAEHEGARCIDAMLSDVVGGVRLDRKVLGFHYWNVEELEHVIISPKPESVYTPEEE